LSHYNIIFQLQTPLPKTNTVRGNNQKAGTCFKEGPVTINLDDFIDQISTTIGNQDGLTDFGAREYTLALGDINFVEMADTQDMSSFIWQTSEIDPSFFTLSQLLDLMTIEIVTDGVSGL